MMNDATKKKVQARLRRIAGQVDGITRMVDSDRYCVDVLRQIQAAQAALGQAGKLVLRAHIETCVAQAIETGRPKRRAEKIDELMEVFGGRGSL